MFFTRPIFNIYLFIIRVFSYFMQRFIECRGLPARGVRQLTPGNRLTVPYGRTTSDTARLLSDRLTQAVSKSQRYV